jgi:hypothetical protein
MFGRAIFLSCTIDMKVRWLQLPSKRVVILVAVLITIAATFLSGSRYPQLIKPLNRPETGQLCPI